MNKLRRELGLFDAITIIIGIMIGSGIFFIPTFVFNRAGAPGMALMVWLVAGIISLVSGLCYAELGAAMPKCGGSYVYLKEAFGPIWGFLSTWTGFLVGGPGSIAALAVAFASYANFFLNISALGVKLLSIFAVIFLTAINIIGVKQGAWVQKVFTVAKVIPIVAIIAFGLMFGTSAEFSPLLPQGSLGSTASAFGLALIAALWAFDGWANVTTIAEEIKNPERNLPLSMVIGIGGVTLLYALFNIALLRVLPVASIINSNTPAAMQQKLYLVVLGVSLLQGEL
ncbi:amino acid permease [Clostridium sp. 'deep sea']|nr:amino acid permease [Clostridium sp. 'deep sea']QOR36261.1 amino acid permease [Clostridium sp. 'deep sea']